MGQVLAFGVLAFGAWYLLTGGSSGQLGAALSSVLDPDGDVPTRGPLTSQQYAALQNAERTTLAGNAPATASSSFMGSPAGISSLAATGTAALPLLGVGGVALGITTAGIGIGVAFISYELLKQRASMHTNDVRDAWQRQFIAIHDALGIRPLTYAQTAGSGPGSIEMAEVIFYFDHDPNNTLWKSVTKTQDERVFRAAAVQVENFLRAQGIPVQDVQ